MTGTSDGTETSTVTTDEVGCVTIVGACGSLTTTGFVFAGITTPDGLDGFATAVFLVAPLVVVVVVVVVPGFAAPLLADDEPIVGPKGEFLTIDEPVATEGDGFVVVVAADGDDVGGFVALAVAVVVVVVVTGLF